MGLRVGVANYFGLVGVANFFMVVGVANFFLGLSIGIDDTNTYR